MRSSRIFLLVFLGFALSATRAYAVPAFARQTGMSCAQCHTIFPELTPFGRQFKAGGYTQTTTKQVSDGGTDGKRTTLEMPANVPLGVQFLIGSTHTAARQQVAPSGPPALNNDIAFPQQFSFFYAGKIAPELGAFVQLTYEGPADHLGFDNADIRYAHRMDVGGKSLILGATLNNSPTVSDIYNTTSAWGVPFTGSDSAPSPMAATLVDGALGQAVAGGGAYAFYNGAVDVYAELQAYRSAPLGVSLPLDASTGATGIIDGALPYWRVAVEKTMDNQSFAVGTFGLDGTLLLADDTHPLKGPGDHYLDVGVDAQYQYLGEENILTAQLTYIHERQTLRASQAFGNADNLHETLDSYKASASYIYDRLVGARLTLAAMRGNSDATLYADQGPKATAINSEFFVTPWYNTKLGIMYTSYLDFNGRSSNYDGAGRNAADNNTLYSYLWLAF